MLEGLERDVAVRYFRAISGFRVRETGMEEQIPEKVDFLELYGCGSVQELKSRQRWKNNHPGKRLKVPVGRGRGGRSSAWISMRSFMDLMADRGNNGFRKK